MSATTEQRPQHISFASPSASLRQSTLKKNMSITQTYYLAHKARGKLSREAAQPDHDLRLLVGHANLLDTLMVELADAEREQERWFNQSVRQSAASQKDRHVQWAEAPIMEEEDDEDIYEEDSDSSDDDYEEDEIMAAPLPAVAGKPGAAAAPRVDVSTQEVYEDDDIMDDDLEEDYAQLELVRTSSHTTSPPPELVDESDSSDDESMPPSPPNALLPVPAEAKQDDEESLFDEEAEYYRSERSAPIGVASAISVY